MTRIPSAIAGAVVAAFLLSGCSVISALSGTSPAVSSTVYSLDQAYSVADNVVANAINAGLVKNTSTVAKIKASSQVAHDALKSASSAEASGAVNAVALYNTAQAAIVAFESVATSAGIALPAAATPPAQQ